MIKAHILHNKTCEKLSWVMTILFRCIHFGTTDSSSSGCEKQDGQISSKSHLSCYWLDINCTLIKVLFNLNFIHLQHTLNAHLNTAEKFHGRQLDGDANDGTQVSTPSRMHSSRITLSVMRQIIVETRMPHPVVRGVL